MRISGLFARLRRNAVPVLMAIAVAVSGGGARAGEEDSLSEKARLLLDYQAFMKGDRDGVVRFAVAASRELRDTPLAELAVRLALAYPVETLSAVGMGEVEARRVLSGEGDLTPGHRDILRRFVARSFAAAGRTEDAVQVHVRRGLAMSWLVAGPFVGPEGVGMGDAPPPEAGPVQDADVVADPPDAEAFRLWRKRPPWRKVPAGGTFPYLRPWRLAGRDDDGPMLLFTNVSVDAADAKASFHIQSDVSWRLFVDGALLAEVDRSRGEAPAEHAVPCSLSAGGHAIMVQVFPPPLGVDRREARVALRLDSESTFSWDSLAAPPVTALAGAGSRREARPLRYLAELGDAAPGRPVLMAAYALALWEQGMPDEAAWWAESAAREEPTAFMRFLAGTMVERNPMLPPEQRGDLAAYWHGSALEEKPDIAPSLLFMAARSADAGRSREAEDYLERARAVNPNGSDILLARAEWARRYASGAAIRAAWDECARAFPNSSSVQLAVAAAPGDGFLDMERRLAASRAALAAAPRSSGAGLGLARVLADAGNVEEAESVLRDCLELFADDAGVLADIAAVYARLGRYEPAAEVIAASIRLRPEDAALWRALGDWSMDAGDREGAERYWRVSLAANPGQFRLADMLRHFSGAPVDFLSDGGHDAMALTAAADPGRYSGDVVRLLDRSELFFEADGSYRRLTHEVDLARTRQGGEGLAEIDASGELLAARIVFANGNTIEPEPYPGEGGLRLPVIMPGAAREVRTLESIGAGDAEGSVAPWFFQDPSGKMPLLLSEYVVRVPAGFPLVFSVSNLGRAVDYEARRENGRDVHRWSAKLSLPSFEPDAVHVSERVPSVTVGVKTTWEDVTFRELRRLEGLLSPSRRMRATLANLYPPPEDGRPDPLAAARAVYRFVCDNIDASPGAGDSAAHVHAKRLGDRRLLLLAMLRAAGLDAHPAAARPAAQFMHPPAWELPDAGIFTVPLVRLGIPGGQSYWLDVRFDALPFGKITDDLSGATVLTHLPSGPLFETLPTLPAEDFIAFEERSLRLPAGEEGLLVSGRSLRRGVAGLLRERLLADSDPDRRRNLLLGSVRPVFPDATLRKFDVQRTDEDEASSLERYELVSRSAVEERSSGALAVPLCLEPPRVIASGTRSLPVRRTVCHIRRPHVVRDRNVFRLPDNAVLLGVPRDAHLPGRFGVYQLRVTVRRDNTVEVVRNYHIPAQRIMPWDWADFLAFLDKVDLAERQWIEYAIRK